jgi:hypothetical protein
MPREAVFRIWSTVIAIAAFGSGAALWVVGERLFGGLGLATSALHLCWAIDLRALLRGRWQRGPIVIARLRHRNATDEMRHG